MQEDLLLVRCVIPIRHFRHGDSCICNRQSSGGAALEHCLGRRDSAGTVLASLRECVNAASA